MICNSGARSLWRFICSSSKLASLWTSYSLPHICPSPVAAHGSRKPELIFSSYWNVFFCYISVFLYVPYKNKQPSNYGPQSSDCLGTDWWSGAHSFASHAQVWGKVYSSLRTLCHAIWSLICRFLNSDHLDLQNKEHQEPYSPTLELPGILYSEIKYSKIVKG